MLSITSPTLLMTGISIILTGMIGGVLSMSNPKNNGGSAKFFLPALKAATPVSVNNVSEEDAKEWLRRITTEGIVLTSDGTVPKEVTTGMMDELSEIVYEIVYGYIHS